MATRFNLTEQELHNAAASGNDDTNLGYDDKIPILKRRAAAAAKSSSADGAGADRDESSTTATDGASDPSNTATPSSSSAPTAKDPICVIVVGMAGSGKTTLMAQLQKSLSLKAREAAGTGDHDDVSALRCGLNSMGSDWVGLIKVCI